MLRCVLLCLCLSVAPLGAQELAHPGWRGNSIAPEAWWRHATLVRFPAGTAFAQAAAALDAMSAVGADTLVLPDVGGQADAAAAPGGAKAPLPFAASFGTEDELDTLLREAGARRMHVLLTAPLSRLAAHAGEVRFWMNRGIAGFYLGTLTVADAGSLQGLRSALDHFPGQRILLARGAVAMSQPGRSAPLALRVVSEDAVAATGSPAGGTPQFVEVAPVAAPESGDAEAGMLRGFLPLLLAPGQPIFDSRVIFTEAGRSALQQMLQLRNSRPALRAGHAVVLQSGDVRAWLMKGGGTQRPIVIVENAGKVAGGLHLEAPLRAAGARGTFLRAILRTDGGMGAIHLEGNLLPPGTFAIAELQ